MTTTDPDTERGLYSKYQVYRNTVPPLKLDEPCFVLRYGTDPHAAVALAAYAKSCEAEYPQLAADLREQLRDQPECECDEPACQWCEIHGDTGNRGDDDGCRCNSFSGDCPEHGPR